MQYFEYRASDDGPSKAYTVIPCRPRHRATESAIAPPPIRMAGGREGDIVGCWFTCYSFSMNLLVDERQVPTDAARSERAREPDVLYRSLGNDNVARGLYLLH